MGGAGRRGGGDEEMRIGRGTIGGKKEKRWKGGEE